MRYRNGPDLTAVQQLVNLRANPICDGTGSVHLGKLTWEFAARPSLLGRVYKVRIEHRQYEVPKTYVIEPDLTMLAGGRRLPHVYEQNPARLCLYLPGTGEWSPTKRISGTIVPWTFLWLWYFEEWLAARVRSLEGRRPASSEL
jgi:hypothetical protein